MMADDDRDELAAHLRDAGEVMTQPYYQMLEQRLYTQGETLRLALEIVRAVANVAIPYTTPGQEAIGAIEGHVVKQARALLASADDRQEGGGDGG